MDIWRLLGASLRRWYVLLPLLGLAGVVALTAGQRVAPEHTATASVLLVQPVVGFPGNPYGEMGTTAASLAIVLQSGEASSQVTARGGAATYEVSGVSRTPILRFTARADNAGQAVLTAQTLIDLTNEELATRQEVSGVPTSQRTTSQVLDAPGGTSESTSTRLQRQVVVFGIGAVIAFLMAIFIDDLVLLWRRRRVAPASDSEPSRRHRDARPGIGRRPSADDAVGDGSRRPDGDDQGPVAQAADEKVGTAEVDDRARENADETDASERVATRR